MNYQSIVFIIFCIAVVIVYYLLGRKLQPYVLLAANIGFLAASGWQHLVFACSVTAASFLAGLWLDRINQKTAAAATDKESRARFKKKKRLVLILCLIVVLSPLVVFKYTEFVVTNISMLLTALKLGELPAISMFLPIGISFYTFMAVSYVLDIYWKRYPAVKNPVRYAGFAMYFPHVVQGPIDRCNEFISQTAEGIKFDYDTVTGGAMLALWGLFKKLVIADRLGVFVNGVLEQSGSVDGIFVAIALMVYSIQIYTDFSGCIDIVTGASEMLGIKLRKNFNHPYFSQSMAEFWRRWHISLQEWFKDYVYYPVYTSRFSKKNIKRLKKRSVHLSELFSTCFPVLVVWLVTGVWHGAAWTFVVWGLFHAALLIGGEIAKPAFEWINQKLKINTEAYGWKAWRMLRTFLLCSLGRAFFRAPTIETAMRWIGEIFTGHVPGGYFSTPITSFGMDALNMNVAILAVAALLVVDILQERMELRKVLAKDNTVFRWVLILGLMFVIIIFGMYGPGFDASAFIYGRF